MCYELMIHIACKIAVLGNRASKQKWYIVCKHKNTWAAQQSLFCTFLWKHAQWGFKAGILRRQKCVSEKKSFISFDASDQVKLTSSLHKQLASMFIGFPLKMTCWLLVVIAVKGIHGLWVLFWSENRKNLCWCVSMLVIMVLLSSAFTASEVTDLIDGLTVSVFELLVYDSLCCLNLLE